MMIEQNKQQKNIEFLSWLSIILVLLLAVGGFALSYNALKDVAFNNGLNDWRASVWPLLIDAALVIFSFAVVRANMVGGRTAWPWTLVGVSTIGTIVFNLVHANDQVSSLNLIVMSIPLKHLVAIVPPLALVLAFETLMGMFRDTLKRHWLTRSNQELRQELDNRRNQLDTLETKLKALEDKRQQQADTLKTELAAIQDKIKAKQAELADAGRRPIVILGETSPTELRPFERQEYIAEMVKAGIDRDDILGTFGISDKTLSRDLKTLSERNGHDAN